MKMSFLKTLTCSVCAISALCQARQATGPINLSVNNQTDETIIIEALYTVKPQEDPRLLGMPNPFVYVEVPAQTQKDAQVNRNGGGRLGEIKHIVIRTQDHHHFVTFTQRDFRRITDDQAFDIIIQPNH